MSRTVTQESFDSLTSLWENPDNHLQWSSVFILPAWLKTWWQAFGDGAEPYLGAVRRGDDIIGIAPLLIREKTASILGGVDVCDYLDFVIAPGKEEDFFGVLLDDLKEKGIDHLDLRPLRPDSTVLTHLMPMVQNRKYEVVSQDEGISVELDLPATWDDYLAILSKKQRHEVRRKLRRLNEVDNVEYRCIPVTQDVESFMDTFLELFSLSHEEKATFMTARMESFFRSLAEAMAEIGLLRFGILEVDGQTTSMIMGFDYQDSMYLYNSAYDPQFNSLSVGLLCKVLCLQHSIERGKKKWDFLKGGEPYKYRIGGEQIPLYRCQITIK